MVNVSHKLSVRTLNNQNRNSNLFSCYFSNIISSCVIICTSANNQYYTVSSKNIDEPKKIPTVAEAVTESTDISDDTNHPLTTTTEGPCPIIDLNDDCLYESLKYLNLWDLESVSRTNSRFLLVAEYLFPKAYVLIVFHPDRFTCKTFVVYILF